VRRSIANGGTDKYSLIPMDNRYWQSTGSTTDQKTTLTAGNGINIPMLQEQ
jgi:hypothetical protein